jgi:hypothetical protein
MGHIEDGFNSIKTAAMADKSIYKQVKLGPGGPNLSPNETTSFMVLISALFL